MGLDIMILSFWMLSFKPAFSLSSFTFIKRLFTSSLHREVLQFFFARMIEWLSNLSWIWSLSFINWDTLGKLFNLQASIFSFAKWGQKARVVLAHSLQQSKSIINANCNCFCQHVRVFSLPLTWASFTKTAVRLSYLKNRLGTPNVSPITARQRIKCILGMVLGIICRTWGAFQVGKNDSDHGTRGG